LNNVLNNENENKTENCDNTIEHKENFDDKNEKNNDEMVYF
jgi:hypothetical protein